MVLPKLKKLDKKNTERFTGLRNIVIPKSVKEIDDNTFEHFELLEKIVIPESV